jgi:pimeloyl-ACP methyl ester carboxylesterase
VTAAPERRLEQGPEPASLVVTVDTGDRIHYLDWGRPPGSHLPPLMLVHGLAQTGWAWAPVARRLRESTHVLVPDLRGHGLSDAPREGYGLDSLAFDLLTVLVASGYGDEAGGPPAVVAGHGFAAMVAAVMARLRPGAVAAVALVDGGWEDLAESTGLTAAEFVRGLAEPPEILRTREAFLADRRDYDPATWDADQERAALATVHQVHAGHLVPVTRPHVLKGCVEAMSGYSPAESLGDLAAPLLVAVASSGTADDEEARERQLALDEVVRARQERRLATTVTDLPGAGHNLMRYRPAELSEELLTLLRTVARGEHGAAPGRPR